MAELTIALIALVVSASAAVGLQYYTGDATSLSYSEAYLNALLGFISIEMVRLLIKFVHFDGYMPRLERGLRTSALSNDVQSKIVHTINRAFNTSGEAAHAAAARSIANLFDRIDIHDEKLILRTDYLALDFYQEFWEIILAAQKRLRREGGVPIKVFATHSASVHVWENEDFARSRQQQEEFSKEHGQIYRVLIRPTGSDEKDEIYERILQYMRRNGMKTYFLDQTHTTLVNIHEYMLVAFENAFYAVSWNPMWPPTERGTLSACEVVFGTQALKDEYLVRWHEVTRELNAKPNVGLSLILAKRPSTAILARMTSLP